MEGENEVQKTGKFKKFLKEYGWNALGVALGAGAIYGAGMLGVKLGGKHSDFCWNKALERCDRVSPGLLDTLDEAIKKLNS